MQQTKFLIYIALLKLQTEVSTCTYLQRGVHFIGLLLATDAPTVVKNLSPRRP